MDGTLAANPDIASRAQLATPAPLALARIIAYALPAIPLAALTLPLYVLVPTFYTETLGLSLASVGFALLIVRVFDAVNDPVALLYPMRSNRSYQPVE